MWAQLLQNMINIEYQKHTYTYTQLYTYMNDWQMEYQWNMNHWNLQGLCRYTWAILWSTIIDFLQPSSPRGGASTSPVGCPFPVGLVRRKSVGSSGPKLPEATATMAHLAGWCPWPWGLALYSWMVFGNGNIRYSNGWWLGVPRFQDHQLEARLIGIKSQGFSENIIVYQSFTDDIPCNKGYIPVI